MLRELGEVIRPHWQPARYPGRQDNPYYKNAFSMGPADSLLRPAGPAFSLNKCKGCPRGMFARGGDCGSRSDDSRGSCLTRRHGAASPVGERVRIAPAHDHSAGPDYMGWSSSGSRHRRQCQQFGHCRHSQQTREEKRASAIERQLSRALRPRSGHSRSCSCPVELRVNYRYVPAERPQDRPYPTLHLRQRPEVQASLFARNA